MANYDKYDPKVGGFRAPLAADWSADDLKKVIGVGLNASGQIVKGSGNTGMIGVLVLTEALKAGDIVDPLVQGQVTAFNGNAGTVYYADPTTGVVNATSAAGKYRVGHTVHKDLLIVDVQKLPVPA
ncbi:minor capsid protein [Gordonia phage LilyPad]|nr:minor capsid protein [Gordonia phage LilyPad]